VLALVALSATVIWSTPAPADIQEQRARLPPPARECADPVEGVWMSHAYYAHQRHWYIFTLTVHRRAPGSTELVGEILAEFWNSDDGRAPNPPPCHRGLSHDRALMPAIGTANGDRIEFGGTSVTHLPSLCGEGSFGYAADHFSGTIDPAILEFQSVNNDGGSAVNEPSVFRRIRCIDPPSAPHVPRPVVRPPAFQPPGSGGLCGCAAPGASRP